MVTDSMTRAAPARPDSVLHAALSVAHAALVLLACDLVVRIVPFGAIARRIARPASTKAPRDFTVRRVQWAVDAAHRRMRWIPCLATAIAANRLLARRGVGSELWLGVKTDEATTMAAHAWLIADGRVVTGGAEKKAYQPLHSIVTPAANR